MLTMSRQSPRSSVSSSISHCSSWMFEYSFVFESAARCRPHTGGRWAGGSALASSESVSVIDGARAGLDAAGGCDAGVRAPRGPAATMERWVLQVSGSPRSTDRSMPSSFNRSSGVVNVLACCRRRRADLQLGLPGRSPARGGAGALARSIRFEEHARGQHAEPLPSAAHIARDRRGETIGQQRGESASVGQRQLLRHGRRRSRSRRSAARRNACRSLKG